MPYQYLEDEAIADIGISFSGNTLEDLFLAAAESIYRLQTKVEELSDDAILPFEYTSASLDRLLYQLLDDILYYKDAELLFVRSVQIKALESDDGSYLLRGSFVAGKFDHRTHFIGNDLKAITMHEFWIQQQADGWHGHLIVDI